MSTLLDHAAGWPFLVARGRTRGYRTLLAPAFLTERELHERLSESTGGAAPGRVLSVQLDLPGVGPLSVAYTLDELRASDLDGDRPAGGGAPTDEHGRPLELLYGIVSRERLGGPLDEADLRAARGVALQSYRRFLAAEESFGVELSSAFTLRTAAAPEAPLRAAPDEASAPQPSGSPPRPVPPRERSARGSAPLPALVAAGIAAVLLLAWLLWPSGPPVVQIRNVTACGTPLELRAQLHADGATTVRYHLAQGAAIVPLADATPLTFRSAGTKNVTARAAVALPATPVTLRFVLGEPHTKSSPVTYTATCEKGPAR